jgi:hypothetical protein
MTDDPSALCITETCLGTVALSLKRVETSNASILDPHVLENPPPADGHVVTEDDVRASLPGAAMPSRIASRRLSPGVGPPDFTDLSEADLCFRDDGATGGDPERNPD